MVVLIFIGAPPPPYLHMDPFSQPKPKPKKQYHSRYYRDARNRDASGASEASSADEEPQKNHVEHSPPSPPHRDAVDAPRTPSPSNDNTRPPSWITGRTPYSRGTTSLNVCNPEKKIGPIDPYLKEDLRHRLFIDFDTFLQTILLLPADWRTSFKSAIDHVLADKEFNGLLNEYLKKVNVAVVDHDREKRLYRPHAKMCNRAVNVLQTHQDTKVSDENIVHYHRMDPLVMRGSKDQLKPDIVGMLTQIFASPKDKLKLNALEKYGEAQDAVKKTGGQRQKAVPPLPENNIPAWPQLIDAKEMKATDNALDEGTNAIRLLKAGQDPLKPVPRKKRDGSSLSAATDYRTSVENQASDDIPSASRTKKRKSDSSDESSSKVSRRTYDSQASATARRVLDPIDEDGFPRHLPNDEKARVQCATYAMQILSSAGLRSHALVTLIDRDRLQLTYYDRSAIIVSQAIDIADKEEKRLFVGMLIGCHRLTLPQRGILDHIIEDPYIRGFGKMEERNPINLFDGLKMTLAKSDGTKIILTLGSIVHRQRCLIGRDTCVVLARSAAWPRRELAVKISWPSIHRDSEKNLMDAAKTKADEMAGEGKRHWVLDHLPEILHSQDFHFDDEDSPQRRLIELLIEASYVDEKTFIYEERLLRITVSERLFPITDLADVKDIAQVFHDIFRCHSWLYENPKILHRDMSLKNMMYRRRYHDDSKQKFQILGVLNDYDLSSFLPLKEATSLHRTGTPPYMAHELLGHSDVSHLYRHDVEAFYYVLLLLCCRYEIVQSAEGKVMKELGLKQMPFEQWFDRTLPWQALAAHKHSFLASYETIPTSASFAVFRPWLDGIRYLFRKGRDALSESKTLPPRTRQQSHSNQPRNAEPPVPFDNETLGGYIISTEILEIMSDINGHSLNNHS